MKKKLIYLFIITLVLMAILLSSCSSKDDEQGAVTTDGTSYISDETDASGCHPAQDKIFSTTSLLNIEPEPETAKTVYQYYSEDAFDEYVLVKCKVIKDYYRRLSSNQYIYVGFKCENNANYQFDSQSIIDMLTELDSLIISGHVQNYNFHFSVEQTGLDVKDKTLDFSPTDAFIPIRNGAVDFDYINEELYPKCGYDATVEWRLTRLNLEKQNCAITQGDSLDKLENTISRLIELGIFDNQNYSVLS